MDARSIDVLGLGAVAVDDIVVTPRFPSENSKIEVAEMRKQLGGLAGTALVAAARMGARCAYAGTLGNDESSRFVLGSLAEEGVDVSFVGIEEGARPFHSVVIVAGDGGTRTILFSGAGVKGAHDRLPDAEVIRRSRVVLLDTVGMEGMLRAARIARAEGIARVGDFERADQPSFSELFDLTNHLILPFEFALRLTGSATPQEAIDSLWSSERELVAITNGGEGSWYRSSEFEGQVLHQSAFAVSVSDTTGCGDVFHGAYAAALAAGLPTERRIQLAAAAAAMKAMRPGGPSALPRVDEVERFIEHAGRV